MIKLLFETADTVTLSRHDFEALLAESEQRDDVALIEQRRAREQMLGLDRARRDYLTDGEMQRLLEGESTVRVWREKRGVPQGALATAIGTSASYLAAVEKGEKPGSNELYRKVSMFLDVPLENLLPVEEPVSKPMDRAEQAALQLTARAENGASRDEMAAQARSIIAEWQAVAARDGLQAQVKGTLWRLRTVLVGINRASPWAMQQHQISALGADGRIDTIAIGIEAAIDIVSAAARRLP